MRFAVMYANLWRGLSSEVAVGDVHRLAGLRVPGRGPHLWVSVLLLSEVKQHRDRLLADLPDGWAAHSPGKDGPRRQCAILWDARVWEHVDAGTRPLHRSRLFPSSTRWAPWVILRHRASGDLCGFVSAHYVPSVERAGRPKQLRRLGLYLLGVRRTRRLAVYLSLRTGGPVVGGTDMNVHHVADCRVRAYPFPWRQLWRAGRPLAPCWRGRKPLRTHGRRCIDYLWRVTRARTTFGRVWTEGTHSDHKALGAVVRVAKR